jgi:hypothetical protein
MCYNATTSLITFSISLFCFFSLVYYGLKYKNNDDIFAGIVTILIGNMQLVEYFLWKNQSCNDKNHFWSLLIVVTLFLQGIIGPVSRIWIFDSVSKYTSQFMTLIFFVGLLYTLFTVYQLNWLNQYKLCSKPSETSCRLVWAPYSLMSHDNYGQILFGIHLFFYFFLFLFSYGVFDGASSKSFQKYPVRYSILPVSFVIALLYSHTKTGSIIDSTDTFSSTWCFMAVAFGIVSLLHI